MLLTCLYTIARVAKEIFDTASRNAPQSEKSTESTEERPAPPTTGMSERSAPFEGIRFQERNAAVSATVKIGSVARSVMARETCMNESDSFSESIPATNVIERSHSDL